VESGRKGGYSKMKEVTEKEGRKLLKLLRGTTGKEGAFVRQEFVGKGKQRR